MRISDWSSDVCSSDLHADIGIDEACLGMRLFEAAIDQYIVEDHRHAERPDLERSIRPVRDTEGEAEQPLVVEPAPLDAARGVAAHARGDIGRADHCYSRKQRPGAEGGRGRREDAPS